MARFAVTAVFEVGPGKVPRGANVLDHVSIPGTATHRFSYCDGRTLTVIIDWTAESESAARKASVMWLRLAWTGLTGTYTGDPLSVRIRCLTPKVLARVAAGARRMTSRRRYRQSVLVEGVVVRKVVDPPDDGDDPDDGGLAGVREPRRPKPGPGHLCAALDEPEPII